MSEIERINDQLRRAFEGEAWCGSSLREALAGVTAERALAKPLANAHCIWEIVMQSIASGIIWVSIKPGQVHIAVMNIRRCCEATPSKPQ